MGALNEIGGAEHFHGEFVELAGGWREGVEIGLRLRCNGVRRQLSA